MPKNSHQSRPALLRSWQSLCTIVLILLACPAPAAENFSSYDAVYDIDEWSLDWSPVYGLRVEAHRVVVVNRSAGADVGRIRLWDTFFQRLTGFEGEVRDTSGSVLFRVGLEDVRPIAPFSEFRLYSGDVVRAVDLTAPQPPYIVEVRWTLEIDNPFFWPDWVLGDPYPRRRAGYRVAIPKKKEIRFREAHSGLTRTTSRTSRRKITQWTMTDWVPPRDGEAKIGATYPLLHVAPEEFRVDRRKGRTDSWNALGQWYWDLSADRIQLTEAQEGQVDKRMGEYVGDRARAAALKDWISDRWRYVAIEVGVGGWRPNPARDVFVNRYGDCKDVVFLWVAMMRHAGLTAYPALIRARDPLPIDPDFPKDWFDHVVGMATINGDTLWADPSDARYPLGTLPRRCESRWALVVGDFGGRLIKTPSQSARDSWLATHFEAWLDANGNLDFKARTVASGHFARLLPLHDEMDRTAAVAVILGMSPPAVEGMLESLEVVAADSITATMSGRITGWATTAPERIQIRPRIAGWVPADTLAGGLNPGKVEFPQMAFDTLVIHLPPGWEPEHWPAAPIHTESAGEMRESRTFENGTLTILRHLRWETGERSREDIRSAARLGLAYRNAANTDWLFKRNGNHIPDSSDTSVRQDPQPGEQPDGTAHPTNGRPQDTRDSITPGW